MAFPALNPGFRHFPFAQSQKIQIFYPLSFHSPTANFSRAKFVFALLRAKF
jgi:hypothetical protein